MSLNPHQFGDQQTLFDAPLGQPEQGIFKGNPNARLYRNVKVPSETFNAAVSSGDFSAVLNTPGQDSGVSRGIGLHWQHDLTSAKEHSWGRGHNVVIEADHPGIEHVMSMPRDKATLEKTVAAPGMAHMLGGVLPEVPVRPGAPMRVRAVYTPAPNAEQPVAYNRGDDSARIWRRHEVSFEGRA